MNHSKRNTSKWETVVATLMPSMAVMHPILPCICRTAELQDLVSLLLNFPWKRQKKRGALGHVSKADGPISAVLTEQLSPSRQQGHAQQHNGRDTMFWHVLRFLTFASPGKLRHLTSRGRRGHQEIYSHLSPSQQTDVVKTEPLYNMMTITKSSHHQNSPPPCKWSHYQNLPPP